MEEYRVDIKVRNNIILKKLENLGYKTLGEFCRKNNMMSHVSRIGEIINMKLSPMNARGEFHKWLERFCDLLGCAPYDLFTDTQMHTILETNKKSIQVNEAEMRFMLEHNQPKLLEEVINEDEMQESVIEILKCLSPREAKVLNMRWGIGDYSQSYTLEDISKELDVTRERVRQIEAKAMRKLRHPAIASKLKGFIDLE